MKNRFVKVLVVAQLTLGLTVVAAPPAQAICCPMTMKQVRQAIVGMSVGPSAYTYYGKATITGTYWSNGHVYATWAVTNQSPSLAGTNPMNAGSMDNLSVIYRGPIGSIGHQTTTMSGSWWNPFSWNWSGIFGWLWDQWHKCITGATKALGVLVGTNIVVKGLVEGAASLLDPEGVATLAVGACLATVFG